MLGSSIVKSTAFHSVLGESSVLRPTGETRKRHVHAELLLTALIDAFSILVLFLLMSFSSSGEMLTMSSGMELPKAAKGEQLERQPVVKVEPGKIFVEDQEVTTETLVPALIALRKQWQEQHPGEEYPGIITVQADRRMKYEALNSVVLASSHAGFSDIRFAVIMN